MSIDSSTASPGVGRRTGKGHVQSYGDFRVCDAAGCRTVLSRYNDRAFCWAHSTNTTRAHR